MKVIIVGAHPEAKELINRISSGWNISVVDIDQEILRNFSTNRQIEKIQGDATSNLVLKKAGIEQANAVITLTKNDEINQLKSTVTELRNQLDKAQYERKVAIQEQIQSSADEINQLKRSCQVLRDELETLKFEKKEAVQKTILNSSDEINHLKESTQKLRDELETIIKKLK